MASLSRFRARLALRVRFQVRSPLKCSSCALTPSLPAMPTNTVCAMLRARGETVAFAESCTGGQLCASLVDVPGASYVLNESYVTYANAAKARLLGVSQATLERFGAVSPECAREMAAGVRRVSGADWGVSVTGIAGPDGGTPEKPVGTVFVGVAGKDGVSAHELHFKGDRTWNRTLSASRALNLLRLAMLGK